MSIENLVSSVHISTIKAQFVHPLLKYNFYVDNIPGVLNVHCEATELPEVKSDKSFEDSIKKALEMTKEE